MLHYVRKWGRSLQETAWPPKNIGLNIPGLFRLPWLVPARGISRLQKAKGKALSLARKASLKYSLKAGLLSGL